jgi:hypothetical protein
LEAIPNLDFTLAERLYQAGFRSAREVSETMVDELVENGFSEQEAVQIHENSRKYVFELETKGENEVADGVGLTELHKLLIKAESRDALIAKGVIDLQRLVEIDPEELAGIVGGEEEAEKVKSTLDLFLKGGSLLRAN